jgi:hypothetical protein
MPSEMVRIDVAVQQLGEMVRQEKPSANTTASCGAARTAGSSAVSATAADTS